MLDLIAGEIRGKTPADCIARFGDRVVLTAIEDGFSRTCGKNSAKHTYITEGCFSFEDYIVLEYTASALRRQEESRPVQETRDFRPKAIVRPRATAPDRKPFITQGIGALNNIAGLTKGGAVAPDAPEYAVGDRVKHIKYGEGTVLALQKEPRDYKVTVSFDEAGQKIMYASFAKLKRV